MAASRGAFDLGAASEGTTMKQPWVVYRRGQRAKDFVAVRTFRLKRDAVAYAKRLFETSPCEVSLMQGDRHAFTWVRLGG